MKLALLALFAFATPAPLPEAFHAEEEVVVQSLKSAVRQAAKQRDPIPASASTAPRPSTPRLLEDLPHRLLTEWSPTVSTRPPPIR